MNAYNVKYSTIVRIHLRDLKSTKFTDYLQLKLTNKNMTHLQHCNVTVKQQQTWNSREKTECSRKRARSKKNISKQEGQ
jgi:hypothetical protein